MRYGSLEMLNYRVTAADGTRIMVWGGMTTDEQINRMKHYRDNDIAVMHVSSKQSTEMFTELVNAINAKVVIPHHKNGVQNYRAIMALSAITGNYDKKGGQSPVTHTFTHQSSGFATREEEFADGTEPENAVPAVGAERFPLWYHMEREMQAVDLPRQIMEGKPYPIKALFAMGMNYRMIPDTDYVREALKKLDFFVDTDFFLTDTAKLADIVLPVCSSFERGEFMTYAKGYAWYIRSSTVWETAAPIPRSSAIWHM